MSVKTKVKLMLRPLALTIIAGTVLVSCQSEMVYYPDSTPEKEQLELAQLTVYPDDVRANLDHYTNTLVAWTGIIRGTDAIEGETGGHIYSETVFEHHYFDWQEDRTAEGSKLLLSPAGEGRFRCELRLRKATLDASGYDAEKYTGRGKLAVLYGMPKSVDADGTVVLGYHYIRVFGRDQYNTNELEYGRLGTPIHPVSWNTIHGESYSATR
jgi:hypothetical protein